MSNACLGSGARRRAALGCRRGAHDDGGARRASGARSSARTPASTGFDRAIPTRPAASTSRCAPTSRAHRPPSRSRASSATCPNASADAATAFAKAYKLNQNPTLLPLTATMNGAPVALVAIPAGARVTLEASWPAVLGRDVRLLRPVVAVGRRRSARRCRSPGTRAAARFDTESTGRASDDDGHHERRRVGRARRRETTHVWVVLRDSRGGVDFASYDLVTVR